MTVLHASLPDGPRDFTTVLYYRQPPEAALAGVVRNTILLNAGGRDFGNVNKLCKAYAPVAIPAMPRVPGVIQ